MEVAVEKTLYRGRSTSRRLKLVKTHADDLRLLTTCGIKSNHDVETSLRTPYVDLIGLAPSYCTIHSQSRA